MAEETDTDKQKLQSFELKKKKKIPAGGKTKKIMSKAPLAILVFQKPVPRECKVQREGGKLGEQNLKQ